MFKKVVLILIGIYFCQGILLAQKIDFSINLGCDGRVHTNNSTAIDMEGNIFVAGGTRDGLKVTADAFQKEYQGDSGGRAGGDIYLTKLSPEGEVIYSTYIGGSQDEYYCNQITIDESGNVYVGFTTDSNDLIVSKDACQKNNKGENDHYIIKFNNDCKYLASTYLGGSQSDHWTRLAVNNRTLYLVGCTKSEDFPVTAGVIQDKYNVWGGTEDDKQWMEKDVTVTALSLDLDKMLFSTYLGGDNYEAVNSISFDENGRIILAGNTRSGDFPTSQVCYDNSYAGDYDGFVTILNPGFSKIVYSTFIGTDKADHIQSMESIDLNNIILVGDTQSPDFPVTPNALKQNLDGTQDGFIAKLNINKNELAYSSFIGGAGGDSMKEIQVTDEHKYLLVGRTNSTNFPVTEDALHYTAIGGADLVVLKLDETLENIEYSTYLGGSKNEYMVETGLSPDSKLIITFTSNSEDFPATIEYSQKDSTNINTLVKFNFMQTSANALTIFGNIRNGDYEKVEQMISENKALIDTLASGYSPLLYASVCSRDSIAQLLLDNGADINYKNSANGWDAVHYAAALSKISTLRLLIDSGANLNTLNNDGQTALYQATYYNYYDLCSLLIANKCELNVQDSNGQTALHIAIELKRDSICELLINSGADLTLYTNAQKSAIILAIENNCREKVELLQEKRSRTAAGKRADE
jgi:ankyrin repeat protein